MIHNRYFNLSSFTKGLEPHEFFCCNYTGNWSGIGLTFSNYQNRCSNKHANVSCTIKFVEQIRNKWLKKHKKFVKSKIFSFSFSNYDVSFMTNMLMCSATSISSTCQMNICSESQPCSRIYGINKVNQCNSHMSNLYSYQYSCKCEAK